MEYPVAVANDAVTLPPVTRERRRVNTEDVTPLFACDTFCHGPASVAAVVLSSSSEDFDRERLVQLQQRKAATTRSSSR